MKIKLYNTLTCPYCHMAKHFFDENNVEYEEVDVSKNKKAADEMVEKSGQIGVPVIDIDGKIIVGFDVRALKSALKLK